MDEIRPACRHTSTQLSQLGSVYDRHKFDSQLQFRGIFFLFLFIETKKHYRKRVLFWFLIESLGKEERKIRYYF